MSTMFLTAGFVCRTVLGEGDGTIGARANMADKSGLKSFAEGRRDLHMIDPRHIVVEPGLNSRDFSMSENVEYVAELKASIKKHGVKEPLTVRKAGESVSLVNGECRLRAIMELIAEGVEIAAIPCQSEGTGVNDAKRLVEQYIRNTGKRFSPLELARHCKRFIDFGWDQAQVAEELVITPSYVSQLLSMLEMPEEAQQAVRAGEISASTAATIIREHGEVNGVAIIEAAVEEKRAAEPEPPPQAELPTEDAKPAPTKPKKKVTPKAARKAAEKVTGKRTGYSFGPSKVEIVGGFFSYVGRARSLENVKEEAEKVFAQLFGKD